MLAMSWGPPRGSLGLETLWGVPATTWGPTRVKQKCSRLAAIGIGAKEGEGGVAESFAEGFAEGFAGYRLLVLGPRVPTLG